MTFHLRALALGLGLVSALALASSSAGADTPPSVWDRARDPATADSYRLHLEVQRRLAQGETALGFGFSATHESQKLSVRSMLERANADQSADVRLRFDLGWVYLMLASTEGHSYYARSAELLGAALAAEPDAAAAENAWSRLADACGHIGDHDCEVRAYRKLLVIVTDEARSTRGPERGSAQLNLAEAEMHLGQLKEAIEGYREAMRIASRYSDRDLAAMAMWGLAVALDRSGDRVGADKEALAVQEMERSSGMVGLIHSLDRVFFFPEYEVNWYDAVGAAAEARRPNATVVEQARHWKASEDAFAKFVTGAQRRGEGDRWLELAKVRLAAAKLEREKAEKKRGKLPRAPPSADDEETPL